MESVIKPFAGFAWLASHPWAFPALEVVHIVGIALLFGSLVMLELRLWGLATALPVEPLARMALGLVALGFTLVAGSGLLMFASQPAELLGNSAFLWKMGVIALAGLNAVVFHARGGLRRPGAFTTVQTVLSLGLWVTAIICGRWIAYR